MTAVDLHPPFLADAEARVRGGGRRRAFRTVAADMAALPFPPASFDLLWSEGAAYSSACRGRSRPGRPLLAPGGRIAFSEAVWLTADPRRGRGRSLPGIRR